METFEDDDDAHFCIKCHATISGLDNYVRHRRESGCFRVTEKEGMVQGTASHSAPSKSSGYPEILNADAFFNSLELRSSSAKKKPSRVLSRDKQDPRWRVAKEDNNKQEVVARKRSRKSQSANDEEIVGKVVQVSDKMSILSDADLDNPTDHLGIPSLVGFPDIVASTGSSKSVGLTNNAPSTSKMTMTSKSMQRDHNNSPEPFMNDDVSPKPSSSKRREVWLGDTIMADLVQNRRDHKQDEATLSGYVEYDYVDEEDSDDEDTTIEEGLPVVDEDEEDSGSATDDADQQYPPHGHTGGKWRPTGLTNAINDDDVLQDDEVEVDEESLERPPPSHTGGKWKPTTEITQTSHQSMAEDEEDDEHREPKDDQGSLGREPPPSHTRGKWVPGAGNEERNGFYCNPCGRRLASRLVYNRHLLTELHAKRSIRELDGSLRPPREVRTILRKRKERPVRRRKSATWDTEEAEVSDESRNKKTRKREKEIIWCEMCRTRVRRPQMGKHLLSHYHCRVAGVIPSGPRERDFLLENMANVVRQCPFQCAACRFYCNTEDSFLLHWRSELHTNAQNRISGSYACTSCDFWCEDNDSMESHLISGDHREVVSVMNGSVPIVVRRQRHLSCDSCGLRFRYNLQLRQHVASTGHEATTASDEYQVRLSCSLCREVFRSLVALQRHCLAIHAEEKPEGSSPYFCSFCSLKFGSAEEAVLHRRTSRHKEIARAARRDAKGDGPSSRSCPNCDSRFPGLVELKQHLLESHNELCHRCPRCAETFALPQELARHTRRDRCHPKQESRMTTEDDTEIWRCSQCVYATNSQAEFIYHEALHVGCSVEVEVEAEVEPSLEVLRKFQCPVCCKLFKKQNYLLKHIRIHTGETPFPCPGCETPFATRSKLNVHLPRCSAISSSGTREPDRRRNYVCCECNDAFYTKHALQQHMIRHTGKKFKCPVTGCPTALRTAAELRAHRDRVHRIAEVGDGQRCSECCYVAVNAEQLRRHRRHQHRVERAEAVRETGEGEGGGEPKGLCCPYTDCQFRTKLRSHLRRHLRLHTGAKPYKCPHCFYASNNFENLRKHILSTKRHPGKTIYDCTFCGEYGTNFSRELRAHLLERHPESFPTTELASNHVARIYAGDTNASSREDERLVVSHEIILSKSN